MFPVTLCLENVSCLVVGGGDVALRKVAGLTHEGADVTVVAPEVVSGLQELADTGSVKLERRPYRAGEATTYRLVFAATGVREVNALVCDDASVAGVWVNVADDPELCTFHLPARVERGSLQIAISSGGRAPFVVRRLRELLERWISKEWVGWIEAAARFRDALRSDRVAPARREALFDRFFAETVDGARLRARAPSAAETEAWITGAAGTTAAAPLPGFVSLVGGGPGNAGLVTLRAYRRLMAADAVVYDRLAEPALPCDLPRHVELFPVGKSAGHHSVPQDEINALLVALARQGKRVVRFKGGDPFVFGRGGEEALALRAAGIGFEVIPGVTAGVAGASWAGVPVTHRRVASRVTLFTAHQAAGGDAEIVGDPPGGTAGATVVGYMGISSLGSVVATLLESGFAATTPSALIERATTANQRSVRAALGELVAAAERAGVRPPALIVVGESVALAEQLDWYSGLPLAGERLVVPAPCGTLGEALELAGAETMVVPVPLTPSARVALAALPITGFLARDVGEAEDLGRDLLSLAASPAAVAWCGDEATAAAARHLGWGRVSVLPDFSADALVRAIAERRSA